MSNHDQANILMVDDQPGKLLSYEAILKDLGENLLHARSAREALDLLLRHDIAVVLMDVSMPEIDGFELADMLHQHPRFQKTAIIFISAVHLTDLDRIKGYESGAVDYISVPVVPELLRAKVSVFTELHRKTRQLERLNRELERRVEKRTEEIQSLNGQLEQRVAELETIMQVLPVGVAVSQDPEGRAITANAALGKMLGVAMDENLLLDSLDGISGMELYQQGSRIQADGLPLHRAAVSGKPLGSVELEIRRGEGNATHLLASAIPLFREDGSVRGAVGAFYDVTSRKQLEDLLRERADLLELASEAIMVHGVNGAIQFWNSGAEELYGWSREEAIGRNVTQLLHTRFPDSLHADSFAEVLARDGKWHGDLTQVARNGHELVVASRQALTADGRAILEINRDITKQLKAEEALRKADRMAAMGRVAGIIAHEINNPLEAITNTFYLLASHHSLDDEARYLARLGEEELLRVSHITRQTLGFYRESKDPVDVSLPKLLDDILDLHARRPEFGNISIERQFRTSGCIQGFPVELRQVFLNLIGNAVQAMPDGGNLRLRVTDCFPAAGSVSGVCVSIADTGTGIGPDQAQHVFEPFFTTKSTKGTGLGLWISKGIVQKYGGTIKFRSLRQPGGNITCFRVFFPDSLRQPYARSRPMAESQTNLVELAGAPEFMAKAVILCVDDEEIPRTLRKLILQQQGYEVVAVSSGKEALEALASAHFDLVLTDQMMPGMAGTELARQIKALTPNQPVVIISGVNELPADIAYADLFISKVGGPDALFKGIAETLDRYQETRKGRAQ